MSIFTDLRNKVSQGVSRRALENKISQAIVLMEGHKACGLPTGHSYYQQLWVGVDKASHTYTSKYGIPADSIMVEAPKLRELQTLADGSKPSLSALSLVTGVIAASLGAVILVTICVAIAHNLYHILLVKL